MTAVDDLHHFDRELTRIVDRLNGMTLARAATATVACSDVARFLLDRTRELTNEIPAGATLPDLAPQGLGALIAMLVTAIINKRYQRDFAREWSRSLEVAGKKPT